MKRVLMVLFVVSLFIGCGGKSEIEKLQGEWVTTSDVNTFGFPMSIKMDINEDGTYTYLADIDPMTGERVDEYTEMSKGTWSMKTNGEDLELVLDYMPTPYELEGNKLVLSTGGMEIEFKKQ